jgi:predicted ATPase
VSVVLQALVSMNEAEYIAGNPQFNGSDWMVVVSGCSGAGKSTLLSEMAARGYLVYPEPGRQIVKEQLHIGGDGLPWQNPFKFTELCVSRALFFFNTAMPKDKPAIFDRSIVDNICWIERMGLAIPRSFSLALQRYRYARRVFMTPPWKELFSHDRERRHSFEDAEAEYSGLLESYPANGYEVVLIPRGTSAERADFLERQIGA